jgi:hypothetical protein
MLNLLQQVVTDTLRMPDTVSIAAPVTTTPAPLTAQPAAVSFGQSLVDSFRGAMTIIVAAIPKIIGFLLILFIGWLIAGWVAGLVTRLLRAIRFNDAADKAGIGKFVANSGAGSDSSAAVGGIVKWVIRLVVLLAAFAALGLTAMSLVLSQFLLWLPNLVVAVGVLVLGGMLGRAAGDLTRGATAEGGFSNSDTLATVAKWTIWGFAIIIAVNQIGIGVAVINTLLTGLVAAVALATGLAFGLGGRDLAARKLGDWSQQLGDSGGKAGSAANAAKRQM